MAEQLYPGVYRGVVEDSNDPEKRKRYRVRVFMLHPASVPTEGLPWAESSLFGGKFFGDLPSFEPGDPVFVMFEGGNRRFPVLIGGMMSESSGVPDAPSEVRSDYAETQARWIRVDRAGNKIVMSPLPKERWITIEAGEAIVQLRQNDGVVLIRTTSQVQLTAPQVAVDASEQVTVKTAHLIAQVDEDASVIADVVNIQGASVINIGRYEDPVAGPLLPKTSDEVDMRADSNVKIESGGTLDIDSQNNTTLDCQASALVTAQTELNLYGVNKAVLRSDADVEVTAGGKVKVTATDNVEVSSSQKVLIDGATTVEITGSSGVTIKASASNIAINAEAGNVEITALGNVTMDAQGTATLRSTGPLTLRSDSQVKLEAPVIEATATATAKLDGGASTQILGGFISIG